MCTCMHTFMRINKLNSHAKAALKQTLASVQGALISTREFLQVVAGVSSAPVGDCVSSSCSTCGAIISWHTYSSLNDFSSSPAWCLIKTERRELNAIQRSHCFQLLLLSLWKWMAAAENSHVLSQCDGVSLNASYDLCCLWLKALVGDLTNHIMRLTHYLWFLTASANSVLHIEIISEHRRKHKEIKYINVYKVSPNLSLVASLAQRRQEMPSLLLDRM